MKKLFALGAFVVVSACNSSVPDSGAGVGFNDYSQYEIERAQREAALSGNAVTGPLSAGTLSAPSAVSTTELQSAGIGAAVDAAEAAAGRTTGVAASPSNTSVGISDEQDFGAVASRETIESDAQRLAQNAAQYEVVAPTAVPQRNGDAGPNIVEYALNAPNVKGQEWYSRFRFNSENRYQRNCASYVSPDAAQRDFLARGGPDRDSRGLDPDGDGFACAWDPAPFRSAANAVAAN